MCQSLPARASAPWASSSQVGVISSTLRSPTASRGAVAAVDHLVQAPLQTLRCSGSRLRCRAFGVAVEAVAKRAQLVEVLVRLA